MLSQRPYSSAQLRYDSLKVLTCHYSESLNFPWNSVEAPLEGQISSPLCINSIPSAFQIPIPSSVIWMLVSPDSTPRLDSIMPGGILSGRGCLQTLTLARKALNLAMMVNYSETFSLHLMTGRITHASPTSVESQKRIPVDWLIIFLRRKWMNEFV